MPCAVFQKPSPTSITWLFSVYLTSFDNGARFGSCATTAARNWSITPSRQARLQFNGIGPVEASTVGLLAMVTRTRATRNAARMESILLITGRAFYDGMSGQRAKVKGQRSGQRSRARSKVQG